jgi:hypothetical protein
MDGWICNVLIRVLLGLAVTQIKVPQNTWPHLTVSFEIQNTYSNQLVLLRYCRNVCCLCRVEELSSGIFLRRYQKGCHLEFCVVWLLVGKPEGKRPLGRPRRRWIDNIKIDLLEIGVNVVDWIGLAQDRSRWRALVNSVTNLRVP